MINLISSNPAAFSALAAFCSACFALLGVFAMLFVSHRQIKAQLVSANRQAWINALRDDLAELFEILEWQHLLRPGTYNGQDGYKHVDDRRSRIRFLSHRIRLRLNPREADHIILLGNIARLAESEERFVDAMAECVTQSQAILKREWERVKGLR